MNTHHLRRSWLGFAVLLGCTLSSQAHWLTQTFQLRPGWNAVYLHVDASHITLDDLIATDSNNPIQEVWQWNPTTTAAQFLQSPSVPSDTGTPWSSWLRGQGTTSVLKQLGGNVACLVRIDGSANYTWALKGKAVAPRYKWSATGLNFLGLPATVSPSPTFHAYLAQAPSLLNSIEIFRYPGGPLGASNPARVTSLTGTPVQRGEAYWLRAGFVFNRYFGPFEVVPPDTEGVTFGDATGQKSLRLRNLTSSDLTVTLALINSEGPPTNQPAILGPPPLLLRGPINPVNLTFGHTNLSGPRTWTLKPMGESGSEVEVVLGVDRSAMSGAPGALHAGVLRFTDSLALSQVDLPVSAVSDSTAGLWVGAAAVNQVRHYLKNYERDDEGTPVVTDTGAYVVTNINTSLGDVARAYPLRLIVHADDSGGGVSLLQRVYLGVKLDTNPGLTTREDLLDPQQLASARRISAVHLPWSEANVPWTMAGQLRPGTNLTTTISVGAGDSISNPFIHSYHPDHDNLNATFDGPAPAGTESYAINREIRLEILPPADDFESLTRGHQSLYGEYQEAVTLTGRTKPGRTDPETRRYEVQGVFTLNRITDAVALTTE